MVLLNGREIPELYLELSAQGILQIFVIVLVV